MTLGIRPRLASLLAKGACARALALAFIPALVLLPTIASAQMLTQGDVSSLGSVSSVGGVVNQANSEILSVPDLATAICYVIAVFLTVIGIIRLKQHVDEPGRHPLSRAMLIMTGAGLLFTAPSFASLLINTLGLNFFAGIPLGGTSAATSSASTITLDQMLENFVADVRGPMIILADVLAFALGVILMIQGILSLTHYGTDPRSHSGKHIATKLAIAAVLMSVPQILSVTSMSLFGTAPSTLNVTAVLAYNPASSAGASNVNAAVTAALEFIQIIGFIGFVRGWLLLRAAIEGVGQASQGTAFTHIIGGTLAINIMPTIQAIQNTFGIDVLTLN